ncbi:hypothetical protein FK268_12545 [Tsukamurella sputi]|uniref:Glycine-rich domain-containing protein n=1 Tax=Tsukamurella sputi TaxID=2591848 RepID=A0A5C5RP67_9ACTN|nr:hypothetical protein [Tsukamurella sputi]TWS24412.1 hypothetical protein FK268_12545 [Tsukamurella sputi]
MTWSPVPLPSPPDGRLGWSPDGVTDPVVPDDQRGWTPELWAQAAEMTGHGELAARAYLNAYITAQLAGAGTLAAQAYANAYVTAQLSGAGVLEAKAYAKLYVAAAGMVGAGVLTASVGVPARGPQSQSGAGTYAAPWWARYCDVILLGGGASGQTGSGAVGTTGKGGNPGLWAVTTIDLGQYHGPWSITLAVGTGGPQAANSDLAAPNPGSASTAAWTGGGSLNAAGGSGTVASGQNGGAPGDQTYQGVTYPGGPSGTGNAGAGGTPGGGGAGGNGGIFGSRTRGGPGGPGFAAAVFRQG